MRIGVPKEIKNNENRVAMTPMGVRAFQQAGHQVYIESNAGINAGFTDQDYKDAGAFIVNSPENIWSQDMVLKVKEPIKEEYKYFREDLIVFAYLHLAADLELTEALVQSKVTGIAYETIQDSNGALPLLTPMSEIAGTIAPQIGAQYLEKHYGGKGILLCGIPGVPRGKVTIIGGGVAGTSAAKIAIGLGADVTVIDINPKRLSKLEDQFGNQIQTLISNPYYIGEAVTQSDLVIGAVLIPGTKAPKLVSEEMVRAMKPKTVLVDIAIDQGGIFETSNRVTTHDNPIYEKHGVIHYSVANIPGAVPVTATIGLANIVLPYALKIANNGLVNVIKQDSSFYKGINTMKGYITYKAVAEAHGLDFKEVSTILREAEKLSI